MAGRRPRRRKAGNGGGPTRATPPPTPHPPLPTPSPTRPQKLTRKLVHILAGPGFVLCWPLFSASRTARLCAAAVPLCNLARLAAVGAGLWVDEGTVQSMSREGDR